MHILLILIFFPTLFVIHKISNIEIAKIGYTYKSESVLKTLK